MSMPSATPADAWQAARTAAVLVTSTGWGQVDFAGADAAAFLHGQLSTDVKGLEPGRGHWTTCNSPKGRMLATLYLWRPPAAPDRYAAFVAADLAEPLRKRLALFVLRSKVVVADASGATVRLGVGGPAAADAVRAALGAAPAPGTAIAAAGAEVVALPDGRQVVVVPPGAADEVRARLAAHAAPAPAAAWTWLGVRAGVAMVTAATQDLFVPQASNWDALGALDFRKGCYTGQEIVARMQYLGRLKERLFVLASDAPPPPPGTRLYAPAFGDQACGTVVESAPQGGGSLFAAVVQSEAVGSLALGAPGGPPATVQPLPYDLPEPAAPRTARPAVKP